MDLGFQGKRAVVSGSTAGIGFAIASLLALEGAEVLVSGRTSERVNSAVEKIRQLTKNKSVRGVAADLGTPAGIESFQKEITKTDVLVNNLGIFEPKPFLEIPDEDWFKFFEVNVMSGVRLSRYYLPGMVERKWGRIIFISSESGQQTPAEMVHYGMTKTAQIAVANGIAKSVAATGVTVNSVLVGPTASEGVTDFVKGMAQQQKITPAEVEKRFFTSIRPSSLLKRFQTPEEVATVVAFIASVQAATITGAAVRVEGGVVPTIL
jgi:NAD(P)-dependent dehydrogenase (short-subunit alcohol dehydrogenase family)